jgi:uncharacterized membrane protein HdeD (DUF308 family)
MTTVARTDGTDGLPAWFRRSWLVPLVLGLLLTLGGVVMLVNLGAGVRTLRWLVVLNLVLAAVQALATASLGRRRWVGIVVGLLYLLGAVAGIVWPEVSLLVLVLVVGVSLLVAGAVQAVSAWLARHDAGGWVWSFVLGLLGVVAGLVFLLGNPVISVVVLAVVLGCYLIVAGVTLLALALTLRRVLASA